MKKRSFRIYLILTLFWTAGIFLHSAMPAAGQQRGKRRACLPWCR